MHESTCFPAPAVFGARVEPIVDPARRAVSIRIRLQETTRPYEFPRPNRDECTRSWLIGVGPPVIIVGYAGRHGARESHVFNGADDHEPQLRFYSENPARDGKVIGESSRITEVRGAAVAIVLVMRSTRTLRMVHLLACVSVGCTLNEEPKSAQVDSLVFVMSNCELPGPLEFTADEIALELSETPIVRFESPLDRDQDGLRDDAEYLLAWHFRPYLVYDEQESHLDDALFLYQVTPMAADGMVRLTFFFLNRRDSGAEGTLMVCGHCGDSKSISVTLIHAPDDDRRWSILEIDLEEHNSNGLQVAPWEGYPNKTPIQPQTGMQHFVVYVSEDKHSTYWSHQACEEMKHCAFEEDCSQGPEFLLPVSGTRVQSENNPSFACVGEVQPEVAMNTELGDIADTETHCWGANVFYGYNAVAPFGNIGEPEHRLIDDLGSMGYPGDFAYELGSQEFCGGSSGCYSCSWGLGEFVFDESNSIAKHEIVLRDPDVEVVAVAAWIDSTSNGAVPTVSYQVRNLSEHPVTSPLSITLEVAGSDGTLLHVASVSVPENATGSPITAEQWPTGEFYISSYEPVPAPTITTALPAELVAQLKPSSTVALTVTGEEDLCEPNTLNNSDSIAFSLPDLALAPSGGTRILQATPCTTIGCIAPWKFEPFDDEVWITNASTMTSPGGGVWLGRSIHAWSSSEGAYVEILPEYHVHGLPAIEAGETVSISHTDNLAFGSDNWTSVVEAIGSEDPSLGPGTSAHHAAYFQLRYRVDATDALGEEDEQNNVQTVDIVVTDDRPPEVEIVDVQGPSSPTNDLGEWVFALSYPSADAVPTSEVFTVVAYGSDPDFGETSLLTLDWSASGMGISAIGTQWNVAEFSFDPQSVLGQCRNGTSRTATFLAQVRASDQFLSSDLAIAAIRIEISVGGVFGSDCPPSSGSGRTSSEYAGYRLPICSRYGSSPEPNLGCRGLWLVEQALREPIGPDPIVLGELGEILRSLPPTRLDERILRELSQAHRDPRVLVGGVIEARLEAAAYLENAAAVGPSHPTVRTH